MQLAFWQKLCQKELQATGSLITAERKVPQSTLCRKCQNKCEGHRSVPRNVQLSAPPPKAASGSGHQKSESYKTQFESQSQRNIHLKRIKAIDRASQKYQWVSVFVQRSLTVEDHLVRLQQLWKREDNCTQCRYQNRAHRSHLFWHFLHGVPLELVQKFIHFGGAHPPLPNPTYFGSDQIKCKVIPPALMA